jgi:hypothetical protein
VLILNSCRNIYVHLHKNGGTSVEVSLAPRLRWNDLLLGSTPHGEVMQVFYAERFGLDKHSTAARIKAVVGSEVWRAYRTWATVRCPYSRLASLYGYAASLIEDELRPEHFARIGSEARAQSWISSSDYPTTEPWRFPLVRAYLATRMADRPFSRFLRADELRDEPAFVPQFDALSEDGVLIIDQFAPLEILSASWAALCAEMQLPSVPLTQQNDTPARWRRDHRVLFSNRDDIDFVNERFAQDFRAFSYHMM